MKKTILLSILFTLINFYACKQDDVAIAVKKSENNQTKPTVSTNTETVTPNTIGVEKGKRSNCNSGSDKRCCDRKFCIVTPLSSYDGNEQNNVLNYFEGTIDVVDYQTLVITIPFNKILDDSYNDWFINDVFEAEYFPLYEEIATKMGLSNIAISEGNYDVIQEEGVGYKIYVNYQQQIVEIAE